MKKWLGYIRVSRVGDRAETLISPDLQAERIESYAAARNLQVQLLEPELDISGGKVDRPILSAAIEEIERGDAAGIIVAQLDRLSRMNIVDALQTIRRIESAGARVIAVAENFDAGTPEGRMGRNVFLAMGEMQLDRYKQQFRNAKEQAVRRGIWPMPVIPIGYRRGEDRRLEPHPAKAPLIVRAFEMRAAGASWLPIAKLLGKGQSGASKVVRNRVYLGEINLGEWRNPSAHTPIVPRDLWEAAQIYHPPPSQSGREPALLAGIVRCAGCGYRMSADTLIYKCRPQKAAGPCAAPAIVSRPRIEGIVQEAVETAVASAAQLTVSAVESTAAIDEARAGLEAAEAELALYQQVTRVAGIGIEHFSRGMRERTEAVERARRLVAKARLALVPHTDTGELLAEDRRNALRRSLGVVWVFKNRNRARIRIIATGFEPIIFGPIAWDNRNMPGEIRPPSP